MGSNITRKEIGALFDTSNVDKLVARWISLSIDEASFSTFGIKIGVNSVGDEYTSLMNEINLLSDEDRQMFYDAVRNYESQPESYVNIAEYVPDNNEATVDKNELRKGMSLFMAATTGTLEGFPDLEKRICSNYADAKLLADAHRNIGYRIVLTSGTYDLLHIGHARYLESASRFGEVLFVGVDSDEKVRKRKGPNRPIVGEDERLRLLCHLKGVDFVVKKEESEEKWELIKTVSPDILIATEGNYDEDEIRELESKYVGKVVVLPRQAEISTSETIRRSIIESPTDAS